MTSIPGTTWSQPGPSLWSGTSTRQDQHRHALFCFLMRSIQKIQKSRWPNVAILWQCWSSCGTHSWKALRKLFTLWVLGDHDFGETLGERFDFCPQCYYLARCYAYVWFLCCWGHLSNGIGIRLFVDIDVLLFRSEIGCGNAFDCDSDLGPGTNLFFAWWGAPLVEWYPQVAMQFAMAATVIGAKCLPVACARHRAPSLLFLLQMMLVYVFWRFELIGSNLVQFRLVLPLTLGQWLRNFWVCPIPGCLSRCQFVHVGVQVMDSTFALSLADMFDLDNLSHEHHGCPSCAAFALGRGQCNIPHPLKCILRGGGSREFSYISRAPPPLKRVFLYELVFVKLRDYLKRWGVFLIHFQYLASIACFEKGGEAVSYIDFARPWIFDAHGVFLGNLTK